MRDDHVDTLANELSNISSTINDIYDRLEWLGEALIEVNTTQQRIAAAIETIARCTEER
jgi:uncharacterized protein YukE